VADLARDAGLRESGRLDLNQRPFGPQPHGPPSGRSRTAQSSPIYYSEVTSVSLTLDPELDPVRVWPAKALLTIATSCSEGG